MKTTKRIVSAILCVLMISGVLPLASFAAYENTHVNTGNQIEDLIAVAQTQIGYTEGNSTSQQGGTSGGSGNYTKYGAWYGINPGAWCAMFVSWCANQAGIPGSIVYKHASCDLGMQWFQNNGKWQWSRAVNGNTYQPKRGDIIYFRTNVNQVTDSTHVGIIYNANSSTIYTIEGNASNKCQTKSYSISSTYILGYGTPAYSDNSGGGSTSTGASGLGTYRITATSLTMRSGPGTSNPVVTYLPNGAEINIIQVSSNNWGYGTYNGYSGWISLNSDYSTLVSQYYYITFDPNGGSMTSSTSVFAIKNGQTYVSAINPMPTATRSGYDFGGWYCSEFNYTLSLADTEYFNADKDVTFKAQWTAKLGQYTITTNFDPLNIRDGAGSADTSVIGQIPKDTVVNITAISGDWGFTTYDGVSGWVSLAYCTYYGAPPAVEEPDTGTKTYTLTFDVNGGTMPEGYPTTYQFEHNQYLRDVIPGFPVPTHPDSDMEFYGWYWDRAPDKYNSGSYCWTSGWGSQQYGFWNYPTNNDIIDAKLIAHWVTHSHSYESTVTKVATCIADGITTYTCTGCGESYTETTAKLGHSYTSAVTKAPSCTEAGVMTYTCSICGNDYVEEIAITGHTYSLTGNVVKCTCGQLYPTGWYGEKYCLNGTVVAGLFNVDGDYYFASLITWDIVKNQTVYVTADMSNTFLSDNGDSYYKFDADGKMVKTGFVTGGGNTYYYENTSKVTGLKQVDSDYYYFNTDGTMVKNQYIDIGGGYGLEPGSYYFRADGKMLAKDDGSTREVRYENDGKYRLYIDGVLQTNGLFYVNGDYYYALRDGTLATDRTLYTYYSNELFTPGYYKFGSDAKMEKGTWFNYFDGKVNRIYSTKADGTRNEGLVYSNGGYYFFHENSGELVTNTTIFISADNDNGLGVKSGAYYFGTDGKAENPILTTSATATATADGAETPAAFTAQVESNAAVSADTAATVIVAALPTAVDDEDEE